MSRAEGRAFALGLSAEKPRGRRDAELGNGTAVGATAPWHSPTREAPVARRSAGV